MTLYMLLTRLVGIGDGIEYTLSKGTLGTTGLCELAQNFQTIVVYLRRVTENGRSRALNSEKLGVSYKAKKCSIAGIINLGVLLTHEVTTLKSTHQATASS